MSRTYLKAKSTVLNTAIGRKLRHWNYTRVFTEARAREFADSNWPEATEQERAELVADMLSEAKTYTIGFDEYFMYHFSALPESERREYVSDIERITYCERMNNRKNTIIFDDKALTYEKYKTYYKRDLIGMFKTDDESVTRFSAFIGSHPRFIVKPFDGACGRGVKIIDLSGRDPRTELEKLIREFPRGFVAEELIVQTQELLRLHPQSVNTCRLTSINYGDRIEIIHPFLRCGRGDAVVDNGGSGGIICGINVETGVVFAAVDELGVRYPIHPDTGIALEGFQVPCWNEAKRLVCELAAILPDTRYTGWDLALTEDGWVLQEANDRGAFVGFQLTAGSGVRREMDAILATLLGKGRMSV